MSTLSTLYTNTVFGKPKLVIAVLLLLVAVFGWFAQDFRLDASADSLLLENDPDLEFSREINQRYGVGESVTVAYTPQGDLFSRPELERLAQLREDLLQIERVSSVDSILNVPVFGDTPLTGISEDYQTLMDPDQDLAAAREELVNSPVFRNALVSPDGQTAGILVGFAVDERARELISRRTELRSLEQANELTEDQAAELAAVESEYDAYSVVAADRQSELIARIRSTLDEHRDNAEIYLGGAPMIADDLVTFVRSDLRNFSLAVLILIIGALGLIFRKLRYVAIPIACCAVAGTIMEIGRAHV